MDEHQHVALPKLYGAPAYARPPRPVEEQERPLDLDDLPLEAFRAAADEDLAAAPPGSPAVTALEPAMPPAPAVPNRAAAPGAPASPTAAGPAAERDPASVLQPRPFSLKALARRIGGR